MFTATSYTRRPGFFAALLLLGSAGARAQSLFDAYAPLFTTPRHYVCQHNTVPIHIDGQAIETDWQKAAWTQDFTDIEGDKQPAPALRTRVKMLWDANNLYIYAELQEPHIWANLQHRDTIVFYDNDFEVFIDPDGDAHQYFEYEVNARNTLFDLFMPMPYRNGGKALLSWDAKGIRTAVHHRGTLNNPKDKDVQWSVEMAIPFAAMRFWTEAAPHDSTWWRINFSRVEWDTDIKDGQYVKRLNPDTHRPQKEHNWVWSPQGIVDMHAPERWGYLLFSAAGAGAPQKDFQLPFAEDMKKYLWLVYYKQRDYKKLHGAYAASLKDLALPEKVSDTNGNAYTLSMQALAAQYSARLQYRTRYWTITQEGRPFFADDHE
ncbi:MAG TPA: carbohydrate-binding family 9-like protein [Chitinophaga sp.]